LELEPSPPIGAASQRNASIPAGAAWLSSWSVKQRGGATGCQSWKRAGEVIGEIERGEPCVAFSEATKALMKAIRRMLLGSF